MEKPLYTLNSLRPLFQTAKKFGFASSSFTVECSAQEGFTISYKDGGGVFFQVINSFQNAIVFYNTDEEREENLIYPFEQIDTKLMSLRECFERWLRLLMHRTTLA